MNKYSETDLAQALNDLGIIAGDSILVHSSLIHLGRLSGTDSAGSLKIIIQVLLETIGESGTLTAPAFNFDFCNGKPFDRWNTPAKNMGVLSEAIRTWPGAQRSRHPMQSIAAIGGASTEICDPDTQSSFAINGPFDLLIGKGTKLLLLGATFQAASLIHFAEERGQVPYRYWKTFTGPYIDGDINEKRSYKMYVRRLEFNPQLNLKILGDEMRARGLVASEPLGMGLLQCCSSNDFIQVSSEMMEADPYSLLLNQKEVSAIIAHGKAE